MKVALVHDDLTQKGGAERVVMSLARLFPEAPIFTTAYDRDGTFPEFAGRDVRTSLLQRLPHSGAVSRALLPLYPAAIWQLRPKGFDAVISSSSRFAHGIHTGSTPHLTYCHNPPRFLYQADEYFAAGGPVPPWSRALLRPVLAGLARWDRAAATRPTRYLCNSKVVAQRILDTYGRHAVVIHPPVDVSRFERGTPGPETELPYFLVVSRLLAYKRVDLAAAACASKGRRLVVVGDGPARDLVARAGGESVEMRGVVDDAELLELLHGCQAVIQPGVEDFGFMPIEANAAGKPVVTIGRGGALETVVDGVTGVLFPEHSAEALSAALDEVAARSWDPNRLREHARSFDEPRFHRAILEQVEQVLR